MKRSNRFFFVCEIFSQPNTEPNYISFFGKEKTALLFEKEKKELLELLTKLNYPTEEIKILIDFTFQNQTKK